MDYKKHGFELAREGNVRTKEGDWIVQVHDKMFVSIDDYDFATLIRENEFKHGRNDCNRFEKITIPKPLRTQEDLDDFMRFMKC